MTTVATYRDLTNVAEGAGRSHTGHYRHHLSIALGSIAECETQLIIAKRVQLLSEPDIERAWALAQDVGRLIRRLDQSLSRPGPRAWPLATTH
jgi:four helix bundle protein